MAQPISTSELSVPVARLPALTPRPAARAAARLSRAGLLLGALGLATAVFILTRLLETWRVGPGAPVHHVSILGQPLGYPAANLDAIVVLVLAGAGLLATVLTLLLAIRELIASRRFAHGIARRRPRLQGDVLVVDSDRPLAFCAGLLRPRVCISSGALRVLDDDALAAVLAHERHHARRHDPLRQAATRVLARSLFFVPGLSALAERQHRLAELGADESAVHAVTGGDAALARAILAFADAPARDGSGGVDPERIDHLIGEPPSWRFPAALCLAALAVIALLAAAAALAARLAHGSATLALPLLSREPCVVALALIPAAAGLLVSAGRRWMRP